jgi:hypothetical protein
MYMNSVTKKYVFSALSLISSAILSFVVSPLLFAEPAVQIGADAARGNGLPSQLFGTSGIFTSVSDTLLFVIGALSVIMLIIGGIRYTVSGGNSTAVTAAKNTVLYAIVGLVVAILAFAIINFVLGVIAPGSTGATTT